MALPIPNGAIIILTNECTNECTYCYNKFCKQSETMSWEQMKQTIDFIRDNMAHHEEIRIFFLGGEPLTHFYDLILPAVKYAKEQIKARILFVCTSNGVLFDDDMIKVFIENDIYINISIDGNKELTDTQRPLKGGGSSFDKAYPHLLKAVMYGRIKQSTSVFTPNTVGYMFDSYLFLKESRVPLWHPSLEIASKWDSRALAQYSLQLDKIIQDYCAQEIPVMRLTELDIQEFPAHNTLLFYSDGGISYNFPDYFRNPPTYPNLQKIGTVFDGFDYAKLNDLGEIFAERKERGFLATNSFENCRDCPAASTCINPYNVSHPILKSICEFQSPHNCYQRRLLRFYVNKYKKS